jgi:hypothetical protein
VGGCPPGGPGGRIGCCIMPGGVDDPMPAKTYNSVNSALIVSNTVNVSSQCPSVPSYC